MLRGGVKSGTASAGGQAWRVVFKGTGLCKAQQVLWIDMEMRCVNVIDIGDMCPAKELKFGSYQNRKKKKKKLVKTKQPPPP